MRIYNKEEARAIPILDVAYLVVPFFVNKGNRSTGECCKHTDNKLGNLRFEIDDNYAKCFTCGTKWDTIGLVMDFKRLSFTDALEFLYQNFPSYFSNVEEITERPKWNGLENKEYHFFKINSQLIIGHTVINIREFATEFPEEHDMLLIEKTYKLKEEIDEVYYALLGKYDKEKLEKDKNNIEAKILSLLKKGLKTNLKNIPKEMSLNDFLNINKLKNEDKLKK